MRTNRLLHAINGIREGLWNDLSVKLQFFIALLVILVAILGCVPLADWVLLVLSIGLVIAAEFGNSAVERLADQVSPGQSSQIRKVKDLAAAAVLVAAVAAVAVGVFVFLPSLLSGTFGTCLAALF